METVEMQMIDLAGLSLAYTSSGTGSPVLLVHGWPTSSYLWRGVIPPIAEHNRVIAVDLPGFGRSGKPLDGYDFAFFDAVLDGLLEALGIEQTALAGHDIGGPIALHWAVHRPERTTRLALLNTVVYPEFDPSAIDFVRGLMTPARRDVMTSPQGLAEMMRDGVSNDFTLGDDVIDAVQAPFGNEHARLALAAAGVGLRPSGFAEIARRLPGLTIPVRVIYGAQDRLLPDIATTVARLREDLPHADVTEMPDCGHFLQEEAPARVGDMFARFFADGPA